MAMALVTMPSLMKPVVCLRPKKENPKANTKRGKKNTATDETMNSTDVVDVRSWIATGEEACDSFVKLIEVGLSVYVYCWHR